MSGCTPGGIGAALAHEFHNRGLRVIATARDPSKLDEFSDRGMDVLALDVASSESIAAAVKSVRSLASGKLDILVNNSGLGYHRPLLDTDLAEARRTFDVNFWAVLEMIQAFSPLLLAAKGTIVNNASVAAITPVPYQGIYNASKAAVMMLGDVLASELRPFEIKTITLMTGTVQTNFYKSMHRQVDVKQLPEGSLYAPIQEQISAVTDGSFLQHWMPRDKYAGLVVNDVLKSSGSGLVWRGETTGVPWLISCLPRWVMIWFSGGLGKIDDLVRIRKRMDNAKKTE